jgi:hypothetical protein
MELNPLDFFLQLFDLMPRLQSRKNPTKSCIVGLFFGFVGCGFCFRTFVDFLIPLLMTLLVAMLLEEKFNVVIGNILPALYAFLRATHGNSRLPPQNP